MCARLNMVLNKSPCNRDDEFEPLKLPLLFSEACFVEQFEHDHF